MTGTGVERERQTEILRDRPERVVRLVVVRPLRNLGGQEQRAEALFGNSLRVFDCTVDVEHRHDADGEQARIVEHLDRPTVVRTAQRALEPGVVGGETGLERERREDDLGAHAVACLITETVVSIEVADDRDFPLRCRHEPAWLQVLDHQGAPLADRLDAGHPVAELGVDSLGEDLDRFGDVRVGRDER